jgi:F-box and leucine-rich repeat protein GRR1
LEDIPPLILPHTTENLRVLDLTSCKITDGAVDGIVTHAPRIQTLILSGCSMLTDRALESICKLRDHLDVLMLAHVSNITDRAVFQVARSCPELRCVDVACECLLVWSALNLIFMALLQYFLADIPTFRAVPSTSLSQSNGHGCVRVRLPP